jgi:hypothetical protein
MVAEATRRVVDAAPAVRDLSTSRTRRSQLFRTCTPSSASLCASAVQVSCATGRVALEPAMYDGTFSVRRNRREALQAPTALKLVAPVASQPLSSFYDKPNGVRHPSSMRPICWSQVQHARVHQRWQALRPGGCERCSGAVRKSVLALVASAMLSQALWVSHAGAATNSAVLDALQRRRQADLGLEVESPSAVRAQRLQVLLHWHACTSMHGVEQFMLPTRRSCSKLLPACCVISFELWHAASSVVLNIVRLAEPRVNFTFVSLAEMQSRSAGAPAMCLAVHRVLAGCASAVRQGAKTGATGKLQQCTHPVARRERSIIAQGLARCRAELLAHH